MTSRRAYVRPGLRGAALFLFLAIAALPASAQQTVGLFQSDAATSDGYVLFSPGNYTGAYLLDRDGYVVHSWATPYPPGLSTYLLPNGRLIRGAQVPQHANFINARGHGGRVEEYDWDGNLVWAFDMNTSSRLQHHDIVRLPNGNTVMMVWEIKSSSQAIQAGRDPATIPGDGVWNEVLIEVTPAGQIVWEWSAWNHMVQDFDPSRDNYGVIADNPGKIDINAVPIQDFIHFNGIDYDPIHDQIVVSTREYSEFWILDHGTTTAQAAGDTGGRYGKGGQILYRWGNPEFYGRGGPGDRVLQHQHDSHWIATADPTARRILLFNNGDARGYSSADEIVLPINVDGTFPDPGTGPHGPAAPAWSYVATPPSSLFSPIISGADRLSDGGTFITEGVNGRMIEISPAGDRVWEYVNPIGVAGPLAQGTPPVVNGITRENAVFKARKYPPDYPAFNGKTLDPQGPLESFTAPAPTGDGTGGTDPLTATRLTAAGDQIEVRWDAASCAATADYNVIYGRLADVANRGLLGGECGIGTSGVHLWTGVPADSLFFLVVGTDPTGVYESRWGNDSSGNERNGNAASFQCGATTKDVTATCP